MDRNDKKKQCLTDGSPVTPDHKEINPGTGQQKGYVVLCPEERAKGFIRPLRNRYIHDKCGTVTPISQPIAETYARYPSFYGETFCIGCRAPFSVNEFKWKDTDEAVGS